MHNRISAPPHSVHTEWQAARLLLIFTGWVIDCNITCIQTWLDDDRCCRCMCLAYLLDCLNPDKREIVWTFSVDEMFLINTAFYVFLTNWGKYCFNKHGLFIYLLQTCKLFQKHISGHRPQQTRKIIQIILWNSCHLNNCHHMIQIVTSYNKMMNKQMHSVATSKLAKQYEFVEATNLH